MRYSIELPIPIRDGEVVVLVTGLPKDLSREEADRIGAALRAWALAGKDSR